jgi:CoA:oxalate CoA-transferase
MTGDVEDKSIGPLNGVRVLELGHGIAGPQCAQMLADHGADVIKIEPPPGQGRDDRVSLPISDGESLYFASHNRGKKSIVIDLKHTDGKAVFYGLARSADVVVTNYGAGVPRRLGIDYETLSATNPGLVFAHVTGFGSESPYRDFRAFDGIIQAMSGLPWLTGSAQGEPAFVGAFVADHVAANQAALGILFALFERQRTGVGGFVDISMLDGYMSMLAHIVGEVLELSQSPVREGNQVRTAFANTFAALDGQVFLAPLSNAAWLLMCGVMDAPDWLRAADVRWAMEEGRQKCEAEVAAWCATRTRAEIIDALRAAGVPCGPVNTVEEAVKDPVLTRMGTVTKVSVGSGREIHVPGPPVRFGLVETERSKQIPQLGEHTRELLQGLGYDEVEVERLVTTGAVGAL